jgi:hypothetical protein
MTIEYLKTAMTGNNQGLGQANGYWTQPLGPCPSCGHCPHCGRGGHQLQPFYPTQPWITWGGNVGTVTC